MRKKFRISYYISLSKDYRKNYEDIGASSRAMKYEVKMARCKEDSIRKECWKKWAEVRGLESGMGKSRKEIIKARGSTRKGVKRVS